MRARRRTVTGTVVALAVCLTAAIAVAAGAEEVAARDDRPNVVLIVTDDQPADALETAPASMPYLSRQLADPEGGWIRFPDTFATTPLCCPARATLLTGRTSTATGVLDNHDGEALDDSATLATALRGAGYHTALVGKYLNGYPFPDRPLVPPGWDRWIAKTNTSDATVYAGYTLIVDGIPRAVGGGPWTYSTDVLARFAVESIVRAPADRPFFLWFAPAAPHRPWTPASRHAGTFADLEVPDPPAFAEAEVSDKPAWVRGLPVPTAAQRSRYRSARTDTLEAMLGIDDAIRAIDRALAARGVLDDTVIVLLTDNGYALGEHRWETKSCPYDVCTRVPLVLRVPGAAPNVARGPVANTDVAATIADLAGAVPPPGGVGRSLLAGAAPIEPRGPVELEFLGDDPVVPRWRAIRSRDFLAVVYETGERELYDLTGVLGPPDPFQLENRADDPAYAAVQAAFVARLPDAGWDAVSEAGP